MKKICKGCGGHLYGIFINYNCNRSYGSTGYAAIIAIVGLTIYFYQVFFIIIIKQLVFRCLKGATGNNHLHIVAFKSNGVHIEVGSRQFVEWFFTKAFIYATQSKSSKVIANFTFGILGKTFPFITKIGQGFVLRQGAYTQTNQAQA